MVIYHRLTSPIILEIELRESFPVGNDLCCAGCSMDLAVAEHMNCLLVKNKDASRVFAKMSSEPQDLNGDISGVTPSYSLFGSLND
jgi:hypothetical protein